MPLKNKGREVFNVLIMVFSVYEKDEHGNFECEYFGKHREKALSYLREKNIILSNQLKDWIKENGVNYFKWTNGNNARELYLQMDNVEV